MPHPPGARLFKKGWRLRPAGGRELGRMACGAVYPLRLRLRLPEEDPLPHHKARDRRTP